MKTCADLKSMIDHCYRLADNGATEFAQKGLKICVAKSITERHKSPEDSYQILKSIERASNRIGVDVAFDYAILSYEKNDKSAARQWLRTAKMHAKPIRLDISARITEIKSRYKDRLPLFA